MEFCPNNFLFIPYIYYMQYLYTHLLCAYIIFLFFSRRTSRWHPTTALTLALCYNHYTCVYYYYYYYYYYARVSFRHRPRPLRWCLASDDECVFISSSSISSSSRESYNSYILYVFHTKLERVSTRYTEREREGVNENNIAVFTRAAHSTESR